MASYWKLAKGKYAYITKAGKRGIESTLAKAKQLSGKGSTRSNPKKGGKSKKMASKSKSKSKSRRRGSHIVGTMGLKGLVINTAVVTGLKYAIKRFTPALEPLEDSVALIGAGIAGNVTGTGKSLLQAGVIDLGSELLSNALQGRLGLGATGSVGGYDF